VGHGGVLSTSMPSAVAAAFRQLRHNYPNDEAERQHSERDYCAAKYGRCSAEHDISVYRMAIASLCSANDGMRIGEQREDT